MRQVVIKREANSNELLMVGSRHEASTLINLSFFTNIYMEIKIYGGIIFTLFLVEKIANVINPGDRVRNLYLEDQT